MGFFLSYSKVSGVAPSRAFNDELSTPKCLQIHTIWEPYMHNLEKSPPMWHPRYANGDDRQAGNLFPNENLVHFFAAIACPACHEI
jgi:hypothetical protein